MWCAASVSLLYILNIVDLVLLTENNGWSPHFKYANCRVKGSSRPTNVDTFSSSGAFLVAGPLVWKFEQSAGRHYNYAGPSLYNYRHELKTHIIIIIIIIVIIIIIINTAESNHALYACTFLALTYDTVKHT